MHGRGHLQRGHTQSLWEARSQGEWMAGGKQPGAGHETAGHGKLSTTVLRLKSKFGKWQAKHV